MNQNGNQLIIAGTGHRPKYCPCKYNNNHPWLLDLKNRLRSYLSDSRPDIIRAGGAIGWDTWLAQIALELEIDLHLYLPFDGQGNAWPDESRKEYKRIKSLASKINYTSDHYYPKVFIDRDIQMITGADKVVALLDPNVNSGGTFYTVGEAKKLGLEIVNFWSLYQ